MDNWDEIRERRKRQLKRQAVIDKIKSVFAWIIAVIFGIGVFFTFLGGGDWNIYPFDGSRTNLRRAFLG
jgi:hypothetical protein